MKPYLIACLILIIGANAFAQPDTVQKVNQTTRNSKKQEAKPYVIMISIDGFRWDYAKKYNATHLEDFGRKGVHASSMLPSYPSLTFPNHYAMVTGLYPSHHGIVQNYFYDRNSKSWYSYKGKTAAEGKWYGGTPLWVLAEKQQMLAASFYWVGSEANIKNTYPTYYYKYGEAIGIHDRINTVVNWLKQPAARRPHLITFYFPEVDHAGHKHSPGGKETIAAVHFVDSAINELTKAVAKTGLKLNYIVVSDHGMTAIDTTNVIPTPKIATDTNKFYRADEGVLMHLYAKHQADILTSYDEIKAQQKDYNIYLKNEVPANLHYRAADDCYNRIGDILLIPKWPKTFNTNHKKMDPGAHGYDPDKVMDMYAIFYAWGPNFKSHLKIPEFRNVEIYPMVAKILGLKVTDKVDGTNGLAKEVLKR
ncbi:alkaline phosphatase family protein [Mucilaginibacter ginkgonis]|uniref:Alkaline phosphatase family protein n=1 Tax=Mucilaginibacter ginkgonis TaxID=2682091 RepID=A0A6I4IP29_9SPHI|nr:ectonucleotide pyrophosphatase/phosphodiesterase [Mucilaginibacter ginkgonis]QQL50792.1 alkaline phosphatase family protein [Mucilaginibacter ginkgonis]